MLLLTNDRSPRGLWVVILPGW